MAINLGREERYWSSNSTNSTVSSSASSSSKGRSGSGLSRRCLSVIKEQRARFYIMRRCIIMLLWK